MCNSNRSPYSVDETVLKIHVDTGHMLIYSNNRLCLHAATQYVLLFLYTGGKVQPVSKDILANHYIYGFHVIHVTHSYSGCPFLCEVFPQKLILLFNRRFTLI